MEPKVELEIDAIGKCLQILSQIEGYDVRLRIIRYMTNWAADENAKDILIYQKATQNQGKEGGA